MRPIAVILLDKDGYPILKPAAKKYEPWKDWLFRAWVIGAVVTGVMLVWDWWV